MSSPQTQPSTPKHAPCKELQLEATTYKTYAKREDHHNDKPNNNKSRKNSCLSLCGFCSEQKALGYSQLHVQRLEFGDQKECRDAIHDMHQWNLDEDLPPCSDLTKLWRMQNFEINMETQSQYQELSLNQRHLSWEGSDLQEQLEMMRQFDSIKMKTTESRETQIDAQLSTNEQDPDQDTLSRKERVERYRSKRQGIQKRFQGVRYNMKSEYAKKKLRGPNGQFVKQTPSQTDNSKPKPKCK